MIKEYHRGGTECQPHSAVFFDYCGPKSEELQSWGDIACGHLACDLRQSSFRRVTCGVFYRYAVRLDLKEVQNYPGRYCPYGEGAARLFPLPKRHEMSTILKKKFEIGSRNFWHTTGVMQKPESNLVGDAITDTVGETVY